MLRKYHIKNFKSFKDETTIDLTSSKYEILSQTNVHDNILKGLLFVGPNASGKTNAIEPVKILLGLLFGSRHYSLARYFCRFANDNEMILSYEFIIDNHNIIYDINYLLDAGLITEKLYLDNELILDRIGSNATCTFTDRKTYEDINKETLLLRDIFFNTKFRGNDVLQNWFAFLENSAYIDLFSGSMVSAKSDKPALSNYTIDYLKNNGTSEINDFFRSFGFKQKIEYVSDQDIDYEKDILALVTTVSFIRDEIDQPIPYGWESLGNKNLLKILPIFLNVAKNGGILVFDEFSSGFHNELEELLIRYLMKKSKNAQLLIVSHSTNLLTNSLFRPDQIYAVEFHGNSGTIIDKFSSENPRLAQNLEKMYLSGVFGGLSNYEEKQNHTEQG